ncbi:unnamed protein product [Linum tenue]|uniref:Secreted protein n=1 Tax=Linum tenue TaxID=586396 RepID=A0AAV0IRN2_9ROSI|nr:unnamed protein product [Linum tenue]
MFLGGLLVLVLDPMEPNTRALFDLLHPCQSHRLGLPQPISHLLLVLGRAAAVVGLLEVGMVDRVRPGIPLVGPGCTVRRTVGSCH